MPDMNITSTKKTASEFAVDFQKNGYGASIPMIDGQPLPLMVGFVSDADRQAAVDLIRQAAEATDGSPMEIAEYLYTAMATSANDIKADEAVVIDDDEYIISYSDKAIYAAGIKVADLSDVNEEMSNTVIKTMLIDRARLMMM